MALSKADVILGRYLVERRLLQQDQLDTLLNIAESTGEDMIRETVVGGGLMSPQDYDALVAHAREESLHPGRASAAPPPSPPSASTPAAAPAPRPASPAPPRAPPPPGRQSAITTLPLPDLQPAEAPRARPAQPAAPAGFEDLGLPDLGLPELDPAPAARAPAPPSPRAPAPTASSPRQAPVPSAPAAATHARQVSSPRLAPVAPAPAPARASPPTPSSSRLAPISVTPPANAPPAAPAQSTSSRLPPVAPAPPASPPAAAAPQPPPAPPAPTPPAQASSPRLQPVVAPPPAPAAKAPTAPRPPAPPRSAPQPRGGGGGIMVFDRIDAPEGGADAPPEEAVTVPDLVAQPAEPPAPELPSVVMPSEGIGANPVEDMQLLLRTAVDMGISDLHLHSGQPIVIRRNGRLEEQATQPLARAVVEALVLTLLDESQKARLEEAGELDFSTHAPGAGRFRANVYRHHRGLDAIFRVIPDATPTFASLGLPASLAQFTLYHNGLVLFTGPAGCGKSTTMSALVHLINTTREDHILTIEDPIEYLHRPLKCSVNQRQVGRDTDSFARALRGALREDPDIIVVGELRDLETISLALSAAETGHLVLGTLHTASAVRTVNRIINAYPPEQQDQVRAMLSESLRGVVSQRLVTTANGDRRIPALEVMVVNRAVSNLIKENKGPQIRSILQTSAAEGMYLLDNSLAALVNAGTIKREEAMKYAEEPRRFTGG